MVTIFYLLVIWGTYLEFSWWWLIFALVIDGMLSWQKNKTETALSETKIQLAELAQLLNNPQYRMNLALTEEYVLFREDTEFETDKKKYAKRQNQYKKVNELVYPGASLLSVSEMPNDLAERFTQFHKDWD